MSATSMSTFFNSFSTILDCYFLMSLDIGEIDEMLDNGSRLVTIDSVAEDGSFKILIDLFLGSSAFDSYVLFSFISFSFSFSLASTLLGEITRVTSTFLDSIVIFFSSILVSSSFFSYSLDSSFLVLFSTVDKSYCFSSFFTGDVELLMVSD